MHLLQREIEEIKSDIEKAWEDRSLIQLDNIVKSIEAAIDQLDTGQMRVAEPFARDWRVNEWLKKAVVLYFPTRKIDIADAGPLEFRDKMPLKRNYDKLGVRVVPPAVARRGAHIKPNVVLMPSFVNIGAYIDEDTLIDTWATVGSCAQIGKRVHVSGGVGIGGVLEPLQASPVIIEDDCFIGSRAVIVEGAHIKKEAVLGANVVITSSTKIIDVTGSEPIEYKGVVPERSVVIPGSYTKEFNAGSYQVSCALIIGKRKENTDKKTSLNDALREFKVSI